MIFVSFYHSCQHINTIILFWILKNIDNSKTWTKIKKYKLRKHKEPQKQSVTKTYSVDLLDSKQNMNSRDKAFLGEICVKESSILIGLGNFRTRKFFIKGGLGWSICSGAVPSSNLLCNWGKCLPTNWPYPNGKLCVRNQTVTLSQLKSLHHFVET